MTTKQIERPEMAVSRPAPVIDRYDTALEHEVFPRWVTLFVMVALVAVLAWAVNFSTITLS